MGLTDAAVVIGIAVEYHHTPSNLLQGRNEIVDPMFQLLNFFVAQ